MSKQHSPVPAWRDRENLGNFKYRRYPSLFCFCCLWYMIGRRSKLYSKFKVQTQHCPEGHVDTIWLRADIVALDLLNATRCTQRRVISPGMWGAPRQVFRLSVCLSHSWADVTSTRIGRKEGRSHLHQQSGLFVCTVGSPYMAYMHRRSYQGHGVAHRGIS
jgi:hypothetical protein